MTVEITGVGVDLGGRPVLRGVSAVAREGRWLAVIGPNGAGKSTLLKAVMGLVPFDGVITVGVVRYAASRPATAPGCWPTRRRARCCHRT